MVIGLTFWLEAALSRGLILGAAKKEDARTFFHSTSQFSLCSNTAGRLGEAGVRHTVQVMHCARLLPGRKKYKDKVEM